jgi:SAM-dependent methyltransferase
MANRLRQELRETIERPGRLRSLARPAMVRDFVSSLRDGVEPRPAATERSGSFISRRYGSYEDYLAHQATKLETIDLREYDVAYRRLLAERLRAAGHVQGDFRVLCLAARLGTEVRAFQDLGCFAVGIDLNPGDVNRHVLHGDFHEVQFPDGSADVVFTNSLDHALEPPRVLAEVRRLLSARGLFVVEASLGSDEGFSPREYEAFYWDTLEDLVALIEGEGFERMSSSRFEEPWAGAHMTFRAR